MHHQQQSVHHQNNIKTHCIAPVQWLTMSYCHKTFCDITNHMKIKLNNVTVRLLPAQMLHSKLATKRIYKQLHEIANELRMSSVSHYCLCMGQYKPRNEEIEQENWINSESLATWRLTLSEKCCRCWNTQNLSINTQQNVWTLDDQESWHTTNRCCGKVVFAKDARHSMHRLHY